MKAADFEPVIVEWLDAVEIFQDSTPQSIEHAPLVCRTVGFLIRSDRKGVTLATECHDDHGVHLRTTNFIPRGMVVKIIKLKSRRP